MTTTQLNTVLTAADTPNDITVIRTLFTEYQQWLNVSLCFQGFDQELAALPGAYAPPGGRLYIASHNGEVAGCVALRPMREAGRCEMKRLFVRDAFRGLGVGRILAEKLIADATMIGYHTMMLDTLQRMETARSLYKTLGFIVTPAYYHNPIEGVVYMELDLTTQSRR